MNKEEAIRVLEDNRPSVIFEDEDAQKRMAELCQAIDMAIEALSIDAVQGEWQKVEEQPYFRKHYDTVCCSVCRKKGNRKWNFCPNCGARMRGGGERKEK